MKTGLAFAALLSGVLFTLFLLSLDSCVAEYEIDPRGSLVRVDTTQVGDGPPTVRRVACDWASELPEFRALAVRVAPGDRLVRTRTYSHLLSVAHLEVVSRKLEVFRNGESVLQRREGHLVFWGVMAAISMIPFAIWGVVVLAMLSSPSRRLPKAPSG
ncbi:MAG: hypothetical protein HY293_07745 [Planctomycetes bacterium]|nr:hypothetical protein [Planctomycetota bacterium]